MISNIKLFISLLLVVMILTFVISCSAPRQIIESKNNDTFKIEKGTIVYIQKPKLDFETLVSGKKLNSSDYDGANILKFLYNCSKDILTEKSLSVSNEPTGSSLSLIIELKVYVGKKFRSRSVFMGKLVDNETNNQLWDNIVVMRKNPMPRDEDFNRAISLLFITLIN